MIFNSNFCVSYFCCFAIARIEAYIHIVDEEKHKEKIPKENYAFLFVRNDFKYRIYRDIGVHTEQQRQQQK